MPSFLLLHLFPILHYGAMLEYPRWRSVTFTVWNPWVLGTQACLCVREVPKGKDPPKGIGARFGYGHLPHVGPHTHGSKKST